MACCSDERREDGYATALAVVACLALSGVAAAVVGMTAAELKAAQADLHRTEADYGVDGAQTLAVYALLKSSEPGPLRWSVKAGAASYDVLAEAEPNKLSFAAAAALKDEQLTQLGAAKPRDLRDRLTAAAQAPASAKPAVEALDDGPRWRACGSSYVSALGRADKLAPLSPKAPSETAYEPHIGEVWRLRTRAASGWMDDRLVRFTGDVRAPAALIARRFFRSKGDLPTCDVTLSGQS